MLSHSQQWPYLIAIQEPLRQLRSLIYTLRNISGRSHNFRFYNKSPPTSRLDVCCIIKYKHSIMYLILTSYDISNYFLFKTTVMKRMAETAKGKPCTLYVKHSKLFSLKKVSYYRYAGFHTRLL